MLSLRTCDCLVAKWGSPEGDCHQSAAVSQVVAVSGDIRGFLIAPELMCLLLTPGAPGFNYCLRSHMQMNLLSFLAPMDSSPDYQTFPFCSLNARLASWRASKENLRKVVLAPVRAYKNRRMCQGLLSTLGAWHQLSVEEETQEH